MQLKYRDDITWQDLPRIERPFFARSKLSADLSVPRPRILRSVFKNPLSEAYRRHSRDIDPVALKGLYQKIATGHVMLVLTFKEDVFSPAFIWKDDPDHKDKGYWQLSQELSSEAEFSYKLLLDTVKKPGNWGSVKKAPSDPLFPGANMADTRRAIVNTAIDTTNTVTDGYRKRELAEHSGRYPQLNSGVSENPMEIEKLKYDDEVYGEFAGTIAGAVGMIGTRKPPKSLLKGKNKKDIGIKSPKNINIAERLEELKLQGHGPQRHGGDVSHQQLIDRAVYGKDPASGTIFDAYRKNPDGTPALHIVGKNATRFKSNESFVNAEDFIRNSEEFDKALKTATNNRFQVNMPAEKVLGNDYLNELDGVSRLGSKANPAGWENIDFTDGFIKARYKVDANGNVNLTTMFPEPE